MKKVLSILLLGVGASGLAFGGSTSISLTAPQVTSWTYNGYTASASDLNALNSQLVSEFASIQNQLNSDSFSKMHDLTQLSQGFANANMAAFDNASLLGYQTYDLFALSVGANVGLAVPSFDPSAAASTINSIATNGDEYAGLATGGFAGQFGLNLSFLVPHLYGTLKAGFVPAVPVNGASYQQMMVGLGVDYTVLSPVDYGYFKWRGLTAGSGLTYNSNTTTVTINLGTETSSPFSASIQGNSVTLTAAATDIKTTLAVTDSSVVIPLDLMTSIQFLWILNLAVDLGADLSFSSANIKLGANSDLTVQGLTGATVVPGSATLTATDSSGTGSLLVPRLGAAVGVDLAIVKIDVPVSFYPTTKAFAAGATVGIVW